MRFVEAYFVAEGRVRLAMKAVRRARQARPKPRNGCAGTREDRTIRPMIPALRAAIAAIRYAADRTMRQADADDCCALWLRYRQARRHAVRWGLIVPCETCGKVVVSFCNHHDVCPATDRCLECLGSEEKREPAQEHSVQLWVEGPDPSAVAAVCATFARHARRVHKARKEHLRWKVTAIRCEGGALLVLDCLGRYGPQGHGVFRTMPTDPLLRARPFGPGNPNARLTPATHAGYTPTYHDRLADGFAMLQGHESRHREREEARGA